MFWTFNFSPLCAQRGAVELMNWVTLSVDVHPSTFYLQPILFQLVNIIFCLFWKHKAKHLHFHSAQNYSAVSQQSHLFSIFSHPQTSLFESNWRTVTVFLIWVSETNLLLDQAGHVDVRVDWLDAHLARREGGEWNTFFQKSEGKFHILVRGFKPGWGMDTKSSLNTNSVNLERKFVRTLLNCHERLFFSAEQIIGVYQNISESINNPVSGLVLELLQSSDEKPVSWRGDQRKPRNHLAFPSSSVCSQESEDAA